MAIEKIVVSKIVPNPWNPRQHYDSDSIGELALAMDSQGIFAGALRGRRVNGDVELCFGHRRFRAMKKNGAHSVDVDIVELSDEEMEIQGLIENMQRVELTAIEKADAIAKLCQKRPRTQVAKLTGLDTGYISRMCEISELPSSLRAAVKEMKIAARTAVIAKRVGGEKFAESCIENKISDHTVQEISTAIGKIPEKETREKVKASAAKGHVKSVKDVQDKARKYSTPPTQERIPRVGEFLIGIQINLEHCAEQLEEFAKTPWPVKQDASWRDVEKVFGRLEKSVATIRSAEKPKF
jgi:ParB family transcriptional regulator, chromosome partitioning protein